ncbi:MAG: hypothetical protein JXJ17_16035 [Anaerolineae bacterium]|nr:hypothetical protein [Anaerolineae bacterium]
MSIPPDDDLGTEIPEDDPFGALREQFDEDDISKQPTGPLREPETDFMFGDLPDRFEPPKRVEAPPQKSSDDDSLSSESPAGTPDWLSHAAEPKGPASPTIPSPGWLGHAGALQPPSPPSIDVPDWLNPRPPSPGAEKAAEPSIDEALDWLTDSQILATAQPESAEEERGDLGEDQAGVSAISAEDFSDLFDDSGVEEKPAEKDDVLDWLREPVFEIDESDELEDTREWRDEMPGEGDLFKDTKSAGEPGEEDQELEEILGDLTPGVAEDQPFGEETPALDWLQAPDEPAAPPVSTPPVETETPGWLQALDGLSDDLQPEGQSADDGEVPDWLSELDEQQDKKRAEAAAPEEPPEEPAEIPTVPSPLIASGIPDWLKAAEEDEPEPAPEPLSTTGEKKPVEPEESAPDWLSELGVSSPPASVEAEESQETVPVPGWLQELGSAEPEQPSPIETPVEVPEETEAPDWMAELGEISPALDDQAADKEDATPPPNWLMELEGAEPDRTPPEEKRVEEEEIPEEVEAPDWMAELGEISSAPDDRAVKSEEAAPAPDWLQELGIDESGKPPVEEEPVEEKESADMEESAPVPDWMSELGEAEPDIKFADKVPPVEEETAKGVEEPDWVASLGEAESETPRPVSDEKKDVLEPDWLSELSADESRPSEDEETTPAAADQEEIIPDLLGIEPPAEPVKEAEPDDWFKAFDQALDDMGPAAVEGEDLLGLAGGLLPEEPVEEEEEGIPAPDMGEIPEWLSGFGAVAASPVVDQPSTESGELAKQIQDLRFETITSKSDIEEPVGPEKVGALKDMAGVIQPELIFDGTTLSTAEPLDRLVITEEQIAQIEIVKKLISHEKEEAAPDKSRKRAPVLRWVVMLVLFAAIGAVLFMGISILPEPVPADNVVTAYDIVDEIGSSSGTVLVAFEYGPDTAGELQPLAEAVLTHLAGYDDAVVYGISTQPVGPAQAQEAFTSAGGGDGWINLGYISGRASGISGLTIGTGPGMVSPLSFDYLGEPTSIEFTRLVNGDVDLIVVISGEIEDVRMWIEQAGAQTGIPVLAAVSLRAEPLARPYQESDQLVSVISGIGDAVTYNLQAGDSPDEALLSVWNAQAVGGVVIAAMIFLGGVVSGLSTMRSHREQD